MTMAEEFQRCSSTVLMSFSIIFSSWLAEVPFFVAGMFIDFSSGNSDFFLTIKFRTSFVVFEIFNFALVL